MSSQQPTTVDTLISARWIIPIRPSRTTLEYHSIALRKGQIVDLLPTAEALTRYCADETIELPEHVLLPGLINAHGHAAMALLRGLADDYPLQSWLNDHIWPAEARWVSPEFVRDGSALAALEMLRSGTTCFSDMYFFPEQTAIVAEEAGLRAQLSFPVLEFPTAWARDADDYLHKGLALLDEYRHHERINIAFGPHAPYTVGDEALRRIATLAAETDSAIQIHAHENQAEVDNALRDSGQRPLQRLAALDLLGPRTQLVHMAVLNDEDIERVQASGAHVVHCPSSNLKLASGFCPVQTLQQRGITVALGTDGAASNNSLDLFAEMRLAALLGKAVAGDAAAVTDWQALEMATFNGARALGLDARIGSLEIGKCADIIAVDLSAAEQQPVYQPVSQLVYTAAGTQVTDSWIGGRRVLRQRQSELLDSARIVAQARRWRDKIAAGAIHESP